ncbi:MAG: succinyl-diaminopimelate desuccinylase [Thermomicrobiales bacterium]|nr:succinyl-diaminopimelate desuccinylase [Thermomicrobiales bacterium]
MNLGGDEAKSGALRFLEGRDQEVIDLTAALIAAPSPNLPGDETAPAEVVREALRRYGLPEPKVVAKEPHRPNLIVRIDGAAAGPHLGLCGHLDTKPVGEAAAEWRTDPFRATFDGDRLYGLGSTDMKGAVAAMVLAGAAFAAVADRTAGSLSLVFTADEEYGSRLGARYLVETGALSGIDAIILGEPSGVREDWDAVRIVSRGISCFRILVRGTQTHSSISDMLPTVNAVEAMARLMVGFRREFRPRYPAHPLCPTGPTVNIGVKTLGGVGYGVLPGYAEFWTDVRTTPGMDAQSFRDDVDTALVRAAVEIPEASYEVDFHPTLGWVAPTEVQPEDAVVRAACYSAERVLGASPPLALFPGGTDASQFQGAGGIPTVAAFGPGQLPLAHGANEWVSVTSVVQAMRMYALTAIEFGAGRA